MTREEIFKKLQSVGRAALTFGIENSHSGNLSMRWRDEEGVEHLVITATGAQKGELTWDKVCFPTLNETNYGHFKASTETDIHARVLQFPGAEACMHGHTHYATAVTLEDAPHPLTNPRPEFTPLDPLGIRYLGRVGVDWFRVASGSAEMTETLPRRLETAPLTMIQEHGAIARGATLEEAFFYLCLMEYSGEVAFFAEMIHADLPAARARFDALRADLLGRLPAYGTELDTRRDFADEPDTIESFLTIGYRIFESRYSPFHTGSMSLRTASTILYAPKASMPHDLPGPLLELPLSVDNHEIIGARVPTPAQPLISNDAELTLHRSIYKRTPFKALLHCYLPEADVMVAAAGDSAFTGRPRIVPIDAEGGFLYPAVPILPPDPDPDELCRALLNYRIVIVAHGGVWAAGEQALSEVLRHASSLKDIIHYRILAQMRGLDLVAMEPKRAQSW
jgi:L-fuculose-phosphate aldolase